MTCLRAEIRQLGGPEVIEWVEGEMPMPGPGEVLIEHTAIGLNFIDTYHRGGLYPIELPSGLGLEAAGRIVALGEGANGYAEGDRVAYMGPGLGAYATHRTMPADALFKLPEDVGDDVAAAAILKAATTEGLVERCADGEGRRYSAGPRCRRRGRSDHGAMAQGARCRSDRHGVLGREGDRGTRSRVRSRDPL